MGYKLSAAVINRRKTPGKLTDGLALSFKRNKDGSLSAIQRVKENGKERDITIEVIRGDISTDQLHNIRARAYEKKMAVANGGQVDVVTFRAVWDAFFRALTTAENSKWSQATAHQKQAQILKYIAPSGMWDMPVQDIRSTDIETALAQVRVDRPKLAPKILALVGNVLSYAAHDVKMDGNAALALKVKLRATEKPVRMNKLPAITDLDGLGRMIRKIHASTLYPSTRAALLLQAYSVQRSGEVAGARWDEFVFHDDGRITWSIPRSRMKISDWERKPYDQVLVLPASIGRELLRLERNTDFVFVPRHGSSEHISVEAFSMSFQRLGFRGLAVPHGWRSSLKTLANDAADADGRPLFSNRWVEDVLDHSASGVEVHYTRAQAERGMERVLAWWGNVLDTALKQQFALAHQAP